MFYRLIVFSVCFVSLFSNAKSFEEYEKQVARDAQGVYIVEGDLPLYSKSQLRDYYDSFMSAQSADGTVNPRLIINQVFGKMDSWEGLEKYQISYCVSSLFGANRDTVIEAMEAATTAWSRDINVQFGRSTNYGEVFYGRFKECDNRSNVVFNVSPAASDSEFSARAFFPSFPREYRNILINVGLFSGGLPNGLTLTGILRHELGHTLGFRHEHTRPEALSEDCFEDNNWIILTDYDSNSVMHYPQCNGTGGWALNLTDLDIEGAQSVYGDRESAVIDFFDWNGETIYYPETKKYRYIVYYRIGSNVEYCDLFLENGQQFRIAGAITPYSYDDRIYTNVNPGNVATVRCSVNGTTATVSEYYDGWIYDVYD